MKGAERLDPARTCVLVFDLLEGHVNKDAQSRARFAPVVANARAIVERARSRGAMIAYAHADHRADGATAARTLRDTDNRLRPLASPTDDPGPLLSKAEDKRVVAELRPAAADLLVPKHRWSAFHGTYLDTALRARRIDTLVLVGGSTDVGIASTAYAARDLDYNLVIVSDACTSPEADNHDQFMKRVFPRMSRVRNAAQVILMLEPTGGER